MNRSVEHGVDALVIHGRTVSERYSGKADWDMPAAVKSCLPRATIVGSGDIFDAAAAVDLMKRTGLDGFIVARGAIGNPWIFRDLRCVWENRPLPAPPDMSEQRQVMLEHFELILRDYPEKKGGLYLPQFRRWIRLPPSQTQTSSDILYEGQNTRRCRERHQHLIYEQKTGRIEKPTVQHVILMFSSEADFTVQHFALLLLR